MSKNECQYGALMSIGVQNLAVGKMVDIVSVQKPPKRFLLFFYPVFSVVGKAWIVHHDATMPSHYETEDEDTCDSLSTSLSHGQKTGNMPATETSPLLAGTADVPLPPASLHISLARRVLLVSTMASAALLNVSVDPLPRTVPVWLWLQVELPTVDAIKRFTVQATVIMLPSIGRAFSIPPSRQHMVFSAYSVASGSSMLLWGRMADVRGRWGVFLVGASTFSLFIFLVPFSPAEPWLYVFQVLQGFSSAATVPSGIGILATTFPPGRERNLAFVAVSALSTLGVVLGNIAGGAIGGLLSWKWGFWIPAAMAGVVALSAYAQYPSQLSTCSSQPRRSDTENQQSFGNNPDNDPESVDYIGGIMIFTSLALFQVGLSQGNVDGWANPHVPGLICSSIVFGYISIKMQLRMESAGKNPLVRLSMFRNSGFSAIFALTACFFASFNGFLVFASML